MDEEQMFRTVRQYIAEYPSDLRISQQEYERRLSVCQECEHLTNAMCALCGCFVELRALKRTGYCPSLPDRWQNDTNSPNPNR